MHEEPKITLPVTLRVSVADDAKQRAAESGLTWERWAGEVIECYVVDSRCPHHPASTPAPDAERE